MPIEVLRTLVNQVRTDIHAVRQRAKDGTWIYRPVERAITDEDLQKHLDLKGPHLGVYLLKPGEDMTKLALYDLDDHEGTVGWDKVAQAALDIVQVAMKFDLAAWPVRSGSGHGIHLFFRWDEPQIAKLVRATLERVLMLAGYKLGASEKGIAAEEVDIFPKQDDLKGMSHGSLVALPFGRQSVPLDLQMQELKVALPWLSSAPVRELQDGEVAEEGDEAPQNVDPKIVKEAMSFVPAEDYQRWMVFGMALKLSLGEEGFGLWNEWSSKADNYPGERALKREWVRLKPNGKLTIGTVFFHAQKHGWKPSADHSPLYSDIWCADKVAETYGSIIRHIPSTKGWMIFDGKLWREMHRLEVFELVKDLCSKWSKGVKGKTMRKELTSSKKHAAIVYFLRMSRTPEGVRISTLKEDWNKDEMLMGTPDGVLDLKTGIVLPNPKLQVSLSAVATPGGERRTWQRFLSDITRGNEELERFLQRLAGYSMTGSTEEEKMFLFFGPGGNGKSAFVETLAYVLGEYGTTLSSNMLLADKGGAYLQRHPTELAKLCGKRIAITSETVEGARFNTALIKNLSGGDRIIARHMRQDEFVFDPTHKTLLSSNQLPLLGNVDKAIERRVVLIKLTVQFEKPDLKIKKFMRYEEASGILAWMLEGCQAWQKEGLNIPQSVLDDTREYLQQQDDLQLFLADACSLGKNFYQLSHQLFEAWKEWCDKHGAYIGSQRSFIQRLIVRGYEVKHTRNGTVVAGLKLGPSGPQDPKGLLYPEEDFK